MRLNVVATGSAANTYILSSNDGESLILDAGAAFKKALPAIPDFRKVSGCAVTHEHNDHSRAWLDYSRAGVPVLMSHGTRDALGADEVQCLFPMIVKPMQRVQVGKFQVMAFDVQHDAMEPLGFLIKYQPTGETVLYATDTYYLKYTFPGVNYWIVECNHCEDLIDGETDIALRNRLKESHMSLRRLVDALKANDLTETEKIVLVHLSDKRSDERRMVSEIWDTFGIETEAAAAGKQIELNLTPF